MMSPCTSVTQSALTEYRLGFFAISNTRNQRIEDFCRNNTQVGQCALTVKEFDLEAKVITRPLTDQRPL